ncbi:MAG TPA: ABC transporter ATP-binding protein [Propionibacteriaceae bacterium]|nr:ABC transporter ATP-binding protein [Propionibacteriaceae bacterium]
MAGLAVQLDGRVIPLGDEGPFVVGTGVGADLPIMSTRISDQHLVLTGVGQAWMGCDLGSENGTYLDGTRLHSGVPFDLVPGMRLMLGHAEQGIPLRVVTIRDEATTSVTLGEAAVPEQFAPAPACSSQTDAHRAAGVMISIGRRDGNDLVLADPTVSGHHAIVTPLASGDFLVEDLRSTNGTFVDGVCVHRERAGPGAVVSFGNSFFQLGEAGLLPMNDVEADDSDIKDALVVSELSYRVRDARHSAHGGKLLLDDVSVSVPACSLLAVIGPSGAGKSTLLKAITGKIRPAHGQVLFDGLDMTLFARSLTGRVGMVPQEDLVHRSLTVRQALGYAAALRFTDDTTRAERRVATDWAIAELGLEEQAEMKVHNLSGGQRKRVSVAMELITRPDLLLLDEPTSGLDPNLDLEVMEMLAELAHGSGTGSQGRTVVVVTHSTENLNKADNVLLLAPGGRVAYFGPPDGLLPHFSRQLGEVSWAAIYAYLNDSPVQAADLFASTRPELRAEEVLTPPRRRRPRAVRRWFLPQAFTLLRRQARLMLTDPYSALFTVALPIAIAALTLLVRAPEGLLPAVSIDDVTKPRSVLVVLAFGSVAMGLVPSVRQLVTERVIFQHEASVGVRASAYLTSKVLLLGAVSAVQAALLITVALQLTQHPDQGVFTSLWTELWAASFLMTWTCAVLGLLLSAVVSTAEQVMPLMVIVLMLQLVLGGGVLPAISAGVSQFSWLQPGRWGMAAEAVSLDLNATIICHAEVLRKATEDREVNKKADEATDEANKKAADRAKDAGLPKPKAQKPEYRHTVVDCATVKNQDPLWVHNRRTWLMDMAVLAGWFLAYLVATWLALIRRAR